MRFRLYKLLVVSSCLLRSFLIHEHHRNSEQAYLEAALTLLAFVLNASRDLHCMPLHCLLQLHCASFLFCHKVDAYLILDRSIKAFKLRYHWRVVFASVGLSDQAAYSCDLSGLYDSSLFSLGSLPPSI